MEEIHNDIRLIAEHNERYSKAVYNTLILQKNGQEQPHDVFLEYLSMERTRRNNSLNSKYPKFVAHLMN